MPPVVRQSAALGLEEGQPLNGTDDLRTIVLDARSAFAHAKTEAGRSRVRAAVEQRLADLERSVAERCPDHTLQQRIDGVRQRLLGPRSKPEGRPFG